MASFESEFAELRHLRLIDDRLYSDLSRYTREYKDTSKLLKGIVLIGILPIADLFCAVVYTGKAAWAALRVIGNLLIVHPIDAFNALLDLGIYSTLTIFLAVIAPFQSMLYALRLFTRIISSWVNGTELSIEEDRVSFSETVEAHYADKIFSSEYFKGPRFFTPFNKALECLIQMAAPLSTLISTAAYSFGEALTAVFTALDCIGNAIICKPNHAMERLNDTYVHFSLAVSLALMAPINSLVESFVFISRILSGWAKAFQSDTSMDDLQTTSTQTYVFN